MVAEKPDVYSRAAFVKTLKQRWPDALVMIALWIGGATVNLGYTSDIPERFFVERDPTLSFPTTSYGVVEEVPAWAVFFVGLACCMIAIWITQAIVYLHPTARILYRNPRVAALVVDPGFSFLCLTETIALTFFLDNGAKQFAGRYRPTFFAACNYKGYGTALKTGNFTAYFAATIPGAVGSIKNCLVKDPVKLSNAQLSWPSTHSAWAFAGLGFLSIFLFWVCASVKVNTKSQMWKLFACLPPLVGAGLIATTRARDYFHSFDDVFAGSVLGFSVALFIFWLHYPPAPHMYDDEVEFEELTHAGLPMGVTNSRTDLTQN